MTAWRTKCVILKFVACSREPPVRDSLLRQSSRVVTLEDSRSLDSLTLPEVEPALVDAMSFHLMTLILAAIEPYLLLCLSIIFTVTALHCNIVSVRRFLFVPAYGLTLASFYRIGPTTTLLSPPYLDYALAVTCILNLIILPRILLLQPFVFGETLQNNYSSLPGTSWTRMTWETLHKSSKVWNNPRAISTIFKPRTACSRTYLALFGTVRFLRVVLLTAVHHNLSLHVITPVFMEIRLDDLRPEKRGIVRRAFTDYRQIESFEILLRLLLPLNWVWMNYACLEIYHDCLSIVFTCLMPIDDPDDWPSLYGSILEAYSVQQFWGRFWHRIPRYNLEAVARPISKSVLGEKTLHQAHKVFSAFLIFAFSGIVHALVAWRTTEGFEERDIVFFLANFACVAAERSIVYIFRHFFSAACVIDGNGRSEKTVGLLPRLAGMLWVYAWLIWILPKWQYPKLYLQRQRQLEAEVSFLLGS